MLLLHANHKYVAGLMSAAACCATLKSETAIFWFPNLLQYMNLWHKLQQQTSESASFHPSQLDPLFLRACFLWLSLPFLAMYMSGKVVWATKKLRYGTPLLSPHIHTTWEGYFSAFLTAQ